MTTYVIMISEFFPAGHIKAGQPTGFPLSIKHYEKIHTIRGNYELWAKRFEKIEKGQAWLSLRVWAGKPYRSKQLEIFRYNKSSDIGIEKLQLDPVLGWFINDIDSDVNTEDIAENDGLSLPDFKSWFKKYDLTEPLAIIHFSGFRYQEMIGKSTYIPQTGHATEDQWREFLQIN